MKAKTTALLISLIALGSLSASAGTDTVSGTELSGLKYSPNGGVAQYVAGTPDYAQLYTADSGLNGGAPAVFVKAANVGFPSLGTFRHFQRELRSSRPTHRAGWDPTLLAYLSVCSRWRLHRGNQHGWT